MNHHVVDGLVGWTRYAPDRVAIIFDGADRITYRELSQWSDNAAWLLSENGVQKGDRIGIVGANSLEWVAAGIGALKAGAIVVPMNERFVAHELGELVEISGARMILSDDKVGAAAKEVAADRDLAALRLEDFTELRDADHRPFEVAEVNTADPAFLIFTSGTSARPKAAIYTHDGMWRMFFENALTNSVVKEGSRWMYLLGMSGAPGLPWNILQALSRGAVLYYEKAFDPQTSLNRLADEKIEMMVGVPMLFEAMMACPEFADADLSHLKHTSIAGARCAPSVLKAWLEKGVVLRQAYGMTEVTGTYTMNTIEDAFDKPDYCGRGSVFSEHRVIRPDGSDCDPGELGEIVIKSPMLIEGYWENPEATRDAFRDGWFHTGDLGNLDETGSVRIIDRLKDLIISGGYNVAPAEVENVLSAADGVEEVCVISSPDDKFGEVPTAVIYGSASEDALRQVAESSLASFKRPKHYVLAESPLPRMASGKIARRLIREQFLQPAD